MRPTSVLAFGFLVASVAAFPTAPAPTAPIPTAPIPTAPVPTGTGGPIYYEKRGDDIQLHQKRSPAQPEPRAEARAEKAWFVEKE